MVLVRAADIGTDRLFAREGRSRIRGGQHARTHPSQRRRVVSELMLGVRPHLLDRHTVQAFQSTVRRVQKSVRCFRDSAVATWSPSNQATKYRPLRDL